MQKRIGIKSSLDPIELKNKLAAGAPLLEIFLTTDDINEALPGRVAALVSAHPGLTLTIHAPFRTGGGVVDLEDDDALPVYGLLCSLCEKHENVIGIICHAGHDKMKIVAAVKKLKAAHPRYADHLYIENCHGPLYEVEAFTDLLRSMGCGKVCFDLSHYASHHNEQQLMEALALLGKEFSVYCHISDNFYNAGNPVPKNIGQGVMDHGRILPLIPTGIVETYSKDEKIGAEMVEDYNRLLPLLR